MYIKSILRDKEHRTTRLRITQPRYQSFGASSIVELH